MTNPSVSIIIPVKDDAVRLERCLQALSDQTFTEPYEIVVADNGSSDNPETVVAQFPLARLIHEPTNGSYAARNAALKEVSSEIVAFTDSDCIPQNDWLQIGVTALRSAGIDNFIGGRVRLFAKNPARPTAGEAWDLRQGFHQKRYIEEEHFAATANVFTFRTAFDRTGPFSQAFISSGDRDWGNRAYAADIVPRYVDELVVDHPARGSLKELRTKNTRMLKGDVQLRHKNGRPLMTTRELLIAVCPPIPTLVRNLPKVEPKTMQSGLSYMWAAFYITYTNLFDRLKIVSAERRVQQ